MNLLEIKIREVDVAVGEDVDGEEVFAFGQMGFEERRCEVPVVPLTPGNGVCGVGSGGDFERASGVFTVDVD